MSYANELLKKVLDYYYGRNEYNFSNLYSSEQLIQAENSWDELVFKIEKYLEVEDKSSNFISISKNKYDFYNKLVELVQDLINNLTIYFDIEGELFKLLNEDGVNTSQLNIVRKLQVLKLVGDKLRETMEEISYICSEVIKDESL